MSSDVPAFRARTPRRKAIASLIAAGTVATTVAAVGTGGPSVQAAEGDTVQILSFNDYHGHVEDDTAGSIDGEFGGPAAGGGEYLSAKLTELRGKAGVDASFTVAAGDNIGGSPFFSGLVRDEPSVESLNEMGLDISGVGNHEFDDGVDELLRMQNGGCFDEDGDGVLADRDSAGSAEAADDCYFADAPYQGADFQWLAANVIDDSTDAPLDLDDGRGIADEGGYSIVESNGTEIAFIGMTLDGTDELVAASGVAGYTFADEVETANAIVAELKARPNPVESIFVLLHEGGIPTEFSIDGCVGIAGPIVTINQGLDDEIDGVISGHTQEPYNCTLEGRPVISAWEYGKVVSEMTFDVDADGDVDRDTLAVVNHPVIQSELTADSAVTDVITKWSPIVDDLANDEVGRISADITRGGDPTGSDRGVESDAGNLIADAQLAGIQDFGLNAEIAFMNPGGIRSDLEFAATDPETEDGIVRYGEAFTFQPFNNTMIVLPMTGAQIRSVLVEQCQPGDASRPVLHLGVSEGFTYDLAITTQAGICTDIEVSNVQLDGVDLDDAQTYQVAVNNFLAEGGDNFDTFADVAVADQVNSGLTDLEVLISYFEAAGAPLDPPGTDRVDETFTTLPTPQVAVTPSRILDTREGGLTEDGLFQAEGPLAVGETIELQVTGRGGVAEGAESVVLNVGVIRPGDLGFLTVYPCDEEVPTASNLNFAGGTTVSNAVFAKLSAEGTACIVSSVETELYADVTSYVPAGGSPTAISPARVLDSRTGGTTVDGEDQASGQLAGGEIYELTVTGREDADGNPLLPDDAKAVVLNVGAIQPDGDGYLTVFPCNATDTPPNASNVNYISGVNVANAVTVGIGDDGAVCIFSFDSTNLIADVTGYVPVDGSPDPLSPARLIDTRDEFPVETIDGERAGEGTIAANEVVTLQVAGRGGVADDAIAANLNVTAVRPVAGGFITVYPCTDDVPTASQVNFAGVNNVANSVSALLADDGTVCLVSS
ncbi:MAG: bifunctional metallophosphatase/5'-nucleotidase, partial [Ilumatobacter sp.]|uniref:bifunctional metallophosphatase/5'-nucleotidase n=1 Tax=Ilumatobacter sp. TaxID=1967498 RepID=UPI003C716FFB